MKKKIVFSFLFRFSFSIHFKIHVPNVINHHTHTKTIFIHKLVPRKKYVPKKKEVPNKRRPSFHDEEDHKDVHHEWKYWTSHSHYEDHGHNHRDVSNDVKKDEIFNEGHQDQMDFQKNPIQTDSYFPKRESDDESISTRDMTNGLIGYSYPPQYLPENSLVREIPDKHEEKRTHSYEKGYQKGLQTESGAIYTDESNKFHFGTELEEEDEREKSMVDDVEDDEEVVKTNAGRYFVTEENVERVRSNEGSEIK